MADFSELIIRDYDSLIDALRAVKDHLQISNETLEEIAGLTRGHVDKLLGPSKSKTVGRAVLGLLLGGLGVRLRVEVDLEQAQKMAHRWERRRADHVREQTRLSKQILELAKPIILSQAARKGWETRRRLRGHKGVASAQRATGE
jgi:hypothetical protein